MAHSLSAKKRMRQNVRRRARNRARKDLIKDQMKVFQTAMTAGDVETAGVELNKTVQRMDKVAAKNTIHKKTAARRRSRLTKRLNALRASVASGEHAAKTQAKTRGGKAKATKATKAAKSSNA